MTHFWSIFPILRVKTFFPRNPTLSSITSYEFIAPWQNLEKTNDTIQRKSIQFMQFPIKFHCHYLMTQMPSATTYQFKAYILFLASLNLFLSYCAVSLIFCMLVRPFSSESCEILKNLIKRKCQYSQKWNIWLPIVEKHK